MCEMYEFKPQSYADPTFSARTGSYADRREGFHGKSLGKGGVEPGDGVYE
jgi:hypothetical protein